MQNNNFELNFNQFDYETFLHSLFYKENEELPTTLVIELLNKVKSLEEITSDIIAIIEKYQEKQSLILKYSIFNRKGVYYSTDEQPEEVSEDAVYNLNGDIVGIDNNLKYNKNISDGDDVIYETLMRVRCEKHDAKEHVKLPSFILRLYLNKITIDYDNTCFHKEIVEEIKKYYNTTLYVKIPHSKRIYLISKEHYGFAFITSKIKATDNFDVNKLYNDDFNVIDKEINDFIESKENKSGLIILHGLQGTGKTTYIRNLINKYDKRFIYLPNDLAHYLSEPSFISFISEQAKDSVIILEDCENLLRDRKTSQYVNEGLVNILNISDGLLGDNLNLKFICTFNNDFENIDKALMRKGRLMAKYEFKELCLEKTNNLLKELYGEDIKSNKPLSLSDIFNYNKAEYKKETSKIGF